MSNAFFELIFKQSNQQDLNSLYAIQGDYEKKSVNNNLL